MEKKEKIQKTIAHNVFENNGFFKKKINHSSVVHKNMYVLLKLKKWQTLEARKKIKKICLKLTKKKKKLVYKNNNLQYKLIKEWFCYFTNMYYKERG